MNIQYTVSVQNNSNKIIGSTEEKFIGIKKNSLIKIGNDDNFYTITERGDSFYLKSFTVLDPRLICIDDNVNVNLQPGDNIQITYKEYELLMINEITNPGINYLIDDELTVEGGKLMLNITNGIIMPSKLKVTEIGNNGEIKQLGIKDKGIYLESPTNPIKLNDGLGADALVNLKFVECGNKTLLERTINNINYTDNKTYLNLNYALPHGLKEGQLSVEKSYILLSTPYMGQTASNLSYEICRDFTPNFKIPLMVKNTISPEVIFNRAMMIIDQQLKDIKKLSS